MPRKGKISLIWFRDDEPARRLRLHPAWLRAMTYMVVCLALLAAGGVFSSLELWRRNQEVGEEKRDTEKRLAENMIKLERLQNIDKLLRTSDPSELSQLLAGLGVEMPSVKASAAPPATGKNAPAAVKAPTPEREKAAFDLADVLSKVDLGQVGVENFRVKIDAKAVQYSFDLSNLMPQQSLSGGGQLLVVTREGAMIPLETGKDDLTFQMQRFKQINASAPLPGQLERSAVVGLRLIIAGAGGKTIFSETYPLAQAQ